MNKKEFIEYVSKFFQISSYQIEQIENYKNIIQEENKKYNLTRLDSDENIYSSYFLESIFPYLYSKINFNSKSILDIGSGSGIPGVLIKIFFPNSKVSLLESNSKKCKFLKFLCDSLDIDDIEIINDRAEEYIRNDGYEKFDIVTSRAVSELKNLLEISTGYAKVDGLILEPKGKKWVEEVNSSSKIIKELDLELINNFEYEFNNKKQILLVFKKKNKTNRKYPRRWSLIINS